MTRAYRVAAFAAAFDLCLGLSGLASASGAEPAPATASATQTATTPAAGVSTGAAAQPATSAAPNTVTTSAPQPEAASPTPTPTEAPPAASAAVSAPAAAGAAAADQGPLIGFVKHTKPPALIDSTPGKAAFGLIGAAAEISEGNQIVAANGIQDPSGDIAREIAVAYAAAHGGRVAEAPLLDAHKWTRAKGSDLAAQAGGARYVIDVDSPGMTLIYFSFDWTHFDLMFMSEARVIDAADGAVLAKARCFIKTDKAQGQGHAELLADNAAKLKALIAAKSEACVAKLKTGLKL